MQWLKKNLHKLITKLKVLLVKTLSLFFIIIQKKQYLDTVEVQITVFKGVHVCSLFNRLVFFGFVHVWRIATFLGKL